MSVRFASASSTFLKRTLPAHLAVPFTIGMWVRPTTTGAARTFWYSGQDTTDPDEYRLFRQTAANAFSFARAPGGAESGAVTLGTVVANLWFHVIARVIAANNVRVSVLNANGTFAAGNSATSVTGPAGSSPIEGFGGALDSTEAEFFDGDLAEFFHCNADIGSAGGANLTAQEHALIAVNGPLVNPWVLARLRYYCSFLGGWQQQRPPDAVYRRGQIPIPWTASATQPVAQSHPPQLWTPSQKLLVRRALRGGVTSVAATATSAQTLGKIVQAAAAAEGFEAAGAQALQQAAQAGAGGGSSAVAATAAQALNAIIQAGVAAEGFDATAAQALGQVAQAGAALEGFEAAGAQALQQASQAAAGAEGIDATAPMTLAQLAQAGAGAQAGTEPTGAGAQALKAITQAAAGAEGMDATAAQALGPLAQAAAGAEGIDATAAMTLAKAAQAGAGVEGFDAAGAQTLRQVEQAAAGAAVDPPAGAGAQLLQRVQQSALAVHVPQAGEPGELELGDAGAAALLGGSAAGAGLAATDAGTAVLLGGSAAVAALAKGDASGVKLVVN